MRCRSARLLAAAGLAALALASAGCSSTSTDRTGSIAARSEPRTEAEWRREMEVMGERYRRNPRDAQAAVRYAQALRTIGQRVQAAAVLEQASIHNPNDRALLGAYGRALADSGRFQQALEVLSRAHSPDNPDWRILSVQGAVLDQMGRHDDARRQYASALRLMPDEPSVLSNLGLSYALSRNLAKAEETLRRAVSQPGAEPKARQNLALVVGLRGRFQEAETIARGDLTADEAAENVATLRRMIAEQRDPRQRNKPGSPLTPTAGS
jgi:Flp pilus assembly protein TadD